MKKTLLQYANEEFRNKNYKSAIKLYEKSVEENAQLERIIKTNIEFARKRVGNSRIAVIFHVFHEDEIDQYIKRIKLIAKPFDLIVTTPLQQESFAVKTLKNEFPGAKFFNFRNSGRDVAPFIKTWNIVKNYSLLCKIHTKKGTSRHAEIWRDLLLNGVLNSKSEIENIISAFQEDSSISLAGHEFIYASYKHFIASNAEKINEICDKYSVAKNKNENNGFFMGTMFWMRPEHFPFIERMSDLVFEDESGKNDGGPEHSIERLLGSVTLENKKIILTNTNEQRYPHLRIVKSSYESKVKQFGFQHIVESINEKAIIVGDFNIGLNQDRSITGWLAFKGNPFPREAILFADGRPIMELTCDLFREDLLQAGINKGFHGFRATIPFCLVDSQEHEFTLIDKMSGKRIKSIKSKKNRLSEINVVRQTLAWDSEREKTLKEYLSKKPVGDNIQASIIMPTYNREKKILNAIESVLNQTHRNFELLIVDDGSEDGTEEVVKSLRFDPRVKYTKIERSGVSHARNVGLKQSSGDYVFFLDSDNKWSPDIIQSAISYMESTGLDGAYCGLVAIDDEGQKTHYLGSDFSWVDCLDLNYIDINCVAYKKASFPGASFDESLRRLVDWDFILEFAKSRKIGYMPLLGVEYYDGKASRITNTAYQTKESLVAAIAKIKEKHNTFNYKKDDREYLFESLCKAGEETSSVTTLIISYNHEKYIRETLDSTLKQKSKHKHSIIISDDNSTDQTQEIITRYTKSHPGKIKDISTEKNLGLSGNLRHCIRHTTSKYVAICEGDDYWTSPEKIAKQVDFLERNQDCSMVFSKIHILNESTGEINTLERQEKILKEKLSGEDFINDPHMNLIANFSCCLFRGDILRSMPDYMFETRTNEIAIAFYFERYGKIGFINEPLSVYRQHPAGLWTGSDRVSQLESGLAARKMALRAASKEYKERISGIIERKFTKELKKVRALLN